MKEFDTLRELFSGKRVLYITTKNLDYIRVTQEINYLKSVVLELQVIGSPSSNYLKRVAHVFRCLITQSLKDIDVVFVGFSPQLVLPFFYGKLKRKPMVIDCFLSVYDTMVLDRQEFKSGSIMARFCHSLDTWTLKRVDYVVCDTMAHGHFFEQEFNANPEKMRVLYLEADKSIYYPRNAAAEDDKHKVLYFGSILNLQGVDVILEALKAFQGREDYQFYIIGPIPKNMVKPEFSNIQYINWLTQQELADYIANADLCLAGHFSGDISKAKRTIPGKAYIYEAMERPMIFGDGPANHELFSEDDKHLFVEMGNPEALAQAIFKFFGE
ncbi:MAG: glycosyltransferase [Pseudobutyrivibrio sp.]|nr:glycosyltransferase [Pseudobutyrivibrio sp.]